MSYGIFAEFYDLLNADADIPRRARALLDIFDRYDARPRLLLDAACGTGDFLSAFLKAGIDVVGADMSPEMLARAREKAEAAGFSPLLICQRLCELDLYGTVDGAVCTFDALNHIADEAELEESIRRIGLFSEPGSLFLFDLHTEYKFRRLLGNRTFVMDRPEVYCVWQNAYDETAGRVDYTLDFFVPDPNRPDVYRRYEEEFSEYFRDDETVERILNRTGYRLEEVLDGDRFGPPGPRSGRKLFVARKV